MRMMGREMDRAPLYEPFILTPYNSDARDVFLYVRIGSEGEVDHTQFTRGDVQVDVEAPSMHRIQL